MDEMNYMDCIGPGILAQNSPKPAWLRELSSGMLGREVADLRNVLTGARRSDVRHVAFEKMYDLVLDQQRIHFVVVLADDFRLKLSFPPESLKLSLHEFSAAFLAPAVLAAFRAEYPGAFFDFRGW